MSSKEAAAAAAAATGAAPAAPAAAKVGVGSRTNFEVWHVRHGERCDEVKGAERQAWKLSPRFKRGGWFDPFLTSCGHVQASRAGLYLKSLFFNQQRQQPGSFDVVYTSPLVRAVQTAVCVSKGLGDLPLQVVPGLCSCTAALRRIGYQRAQHILMTDADIIKTFPGVNLIPRDPLAPTSFDGAAAWLADKACEKEGSDGDGDRCSRVLAVGHREGTKAMAGRKIPTPHCCVGVFHGDTSDKACTYQLHDLLSHTGESIKPWGAASPYAKLATTVMREEDRHSDEGAVEALAAQVIALTVAEAGQEPSRAESRRFVHDARMRRMNNAGPNMTRFGTRGATASSSTAGASARSEPPTGSLNRISSSTTAGLVRRLRGASSSLPSPARTNGQSGARLSASGVQKSSRKTTEPYIAERRQQHQTGHDETGGTTSKGGGKTEPPPPPPQSNEAGSRKAATAAVSTRAGAGLVVDGACGLGFRAAVRHPLRRSPVGAGSTYAGLLGIPVHMLCGASGVLSFLSPTDLCMVQVTCKTTAIAAVSESLWSELYSRLPRGARDRSEQRNLLSGQVETTPGAARTRVHAKVLFASALSTASFAHAARIAGKVAALQMRFPLILSLRRCVDATRAMVKIRVNGEPVSAVQTTRRRTAVWVSRSSLLNEPSVSGNDGVRKFSLSSSVKVEVLASFETVEALRSLRVTLCWPDKEKDAALLLPMPILRIDDRPFLSRARLIGNSADRALVLYDVTGYGRRVNAGHVSPPPSPVLRGCVLLGVLPSNREDGRRDSNPDAGGVGFLTAHFPHDLLLHLATRHPRMKIQDPTDDSGGTGRGLSGFKAALGLRTAGVPLWETASSFLDGRARLPRNAVTGLQHPLNSGEPEVAVIFINLLRHGKNESSASAGGAAAAAVSISERTLSASPRLPYSTRGGLTGVVADLLLADFTLCHDDRPTLWAFTSPIVFEACVSEKAGGSPDGMGDGGASELAGDDDATVDMAYTEVREERRCGIVEEPGVGRVVVQLALVDSPGDNDDSPGHVWMVRSAHVELELGFVDACFGTKHGS
ncbi:unnamed protein product, partial [Hapterophycus canaliculatus]